MRNEKTEMAVEIYCRQNDMEFMEKIRDIGGVEDVTLGFSIMENIMVREVITVAALTAAFSFLGGCTPRAATLPGFRSETKEFSQSGETFGNPLMGYAPCAWEETIGEDISLLYMDITWAELEPEEGKYDWEKNRKRKSD